MRYRYCGRWFKIFVPSPTATYQKRSLSGEHITPLSNRHIDVSKLGVAWLITDKCKQANPKLLCSVNSIRISGWIRSRVVLRYRLVACVYVAHNKTHIKSLWINKDMTQLVYITSESKNVSRFRMGWHPVEVKRRKLLVRFQRPTLPQHTE